MSDTAQVVIQRITDTLYAPIRYTGSGTPEGFVTSEPGWFYFDTTNERLYAKMTGTGNTGWVIASAKRFIGTCAIPSSAGFANKTSVTHGLGRIPDAVTATFVCVSAELGYSIGDEVDWGAISGTSYAPVIVWMPNATTIDVNFGGTAIYLTHKTTGSQTAATPAAWLCKFRAQAFPI